MCFVKYIRKPAVNTGHRLFDKIKLNDFEEHSQAVTEKMLLNLEQKKKKNLASHSDINRLNRRIYDKKDTKMNKCLFSEYIKSFFFGIPVNTAACTALEALRKQRVLV